MREESLFLGITFDVILMIGLDAVSPPVTLGDWETLAGLVISLAAISYAIWSHEHLSERLNDITEGEMNEKIAIGWSERRDFQKLCQASAGGCP